MSFTVEVVCYSIEDVLRARRGGASRVELCADPGAGGTSPNYGLIKQTVALGDIEVAVMIRPRGGDFLYTAEELAVMHDDIRIAGDLGAQCVVFGVLDETGFLNRKAMSQLVQTAKDKNLEVTCHRAFDVARNPLDFLQVLIDLRVDRLLTSGQKKSAVEGKDLLLELITAADGRLSVMPGGGIRPHNIHELLDLPIHEIHTGSSQEVPSKMAQLGRKINMGTDDDQGLHTFVDEEAIRAIVHASKNR